ncbi:hypothetical protein PISL3812_07482 [Talaromyces islandicus]|uniref:PHO85 cyclin-7 n=1 Tax=Talaromyces islandicus TaxID=28573 RepID=A0A0U1M4A6_TALIS|nr:hypothetical protein PISL3812_07482 [Talaromyces islandicus]
MNNCGEAVSGAAEQNKTSPQGADTGSTTSVSESDSDVFQIPPLEALNAVTAHLAELAHRTGDVPATPQPPHSPTDSTDNAKEKHNFAVSITELRSAGDKNVPEADGSGGGVQHHVLAKRFYSKKAPPITLEQYLQRLHKYCPMSTAVYLAASIYITRMVDIERTLVVTPRNVHRLVLAGLRVAMKALEDLSYPHSRFARVGGVTERELTRLEITFCFLTNFGLRVDSHALMRQLTLLRSVPHTHLVLELPPRAKARDDPTAIASKAMPNEIASGAPQR